MSLEKEGCADSISTARAALKRVSRSVLFRNIGGTFVIKGASVIVQLLSVPAYISYFNNDTVLGLWYALVAALNWILVFDFGVGNGLRNNLSKALAEGDVQCGKRLVSTAYIFMGLLALVFVVIGEAMILNIDLEAVLNFHSNQLDPETLKLSVSIVYVGIIAQFWLKLLTSVLYSMQKTALNNFLFLLGNIILLLWVVFARFDDVNDCLIAMSLVQILGINLPLLVCTFVLFLGRFRCIAPAPSFFDRNSVNHVVGLGVEFFVIQIALLVVNSTNEYLITYLYDSSDVLSYQIYYKWFFTAITVFSLIVQPVWSAMTAAWHEGRIEWVRKAYRQFNVIALIGSCGAFALALIFPMIVKLWLGEGLVVATVGIGIVFAFWVTVMLFVNSSTCVSNATSRLRIQMGLTVLAAALKVPVSLALCWLGLGWESVMLANAFVLLPLLIGQTISNKALLRSAS